MDIRDARYILTEYIRKKKKFDQLYEAFRNKFDSMDGLKAKGIQSFTNSGTPNTDSMIEKIVIDTEEARAKCYDAMDKKLDAMNKLMRMINNVPDIDEQILLMNCYIHLENLTATQKKKLPVAEKHFAEFN